MKNLKITNLVNTSLTNYNTKKKVQQSQPLRILQAKHKIHKKYFPDILQSFLNHLNLHKLFKQQAQNLDTPLNIDELHKALLQMTNNKSPGSDDPVSWTFLLEKLQQFRLGESFIQLIKTLYT